MRVLIAEDDQVLADGLLRSLRNAGYAVDQVNQNRKLADVAQSLVTAADLLGPGGL